MSWPQISKEVREYSKPAIRTHNSFLVELLEDYWEHCSHLHCTAAHSTQWMWKKTKEMNVGFRQLNLTASLCVCVCVCGGEHRGVARKLLHRRGGEFRCRGWWRLRKGLWVTSTEVDEGKGPPVSLKTPTKPAYSHYVYALASLLIGMKNKEPQLRSCRKCLHVHGEEALWFGYHVWNFKGEGKKKAQRLWWFCSLLPPH